MRYTRRVATAGLALALGSTISLTTYAQTSGSPSGRASGPASPSWIPGTSYGYIGGSVGRSDYDLGGCLGFSCDDKVTGFKLFTGGRFSRYFGVELGYFNLGEADRNGGDVKAQGANLSLIGIAPIADSFSIFGKLGGNYGWTKTSTTIPGVPAGKEDGLGISYGAGLQYDISKSVGLRADWDRYRLKYVGQRENADLYSVGVVFKF